MIDLTKLPGFKRQRPSTVLALALDGGQLEGVVVRRTNGSVQVLQSVADAHDATPHQVALGFLSRAPSVFPIPKASSAEHATANAGAGDLVLSASEISAIDKAFPRGPKPRGLPML